MIHAYPHTSTVFQISSMIFYSWTVVLNIWSFNSTRIFFIFSILNLCSHFTVIENAPSVIKFMHLNKGFDLYCVGVNLFWNNRDIKTRTEMSGIQFGIANEYWAK